MLDSVLMEIMSSKSDSVYQPWLNDRLKKKEIENGRLQKDEEKSIMIDKKTSNKQLKLF